MLGQRLKRFVRATRDTARERGVPHAIAFAVKTLARKATLIVHAGVSRIGLYGVRGEVRRSRSGAPGRPCLALCLTGGVGDMIVIARFMRDLAAAVPDIDFDVFMTRPDTASFVFGEVPGFRRAYHDALFEPLRREYDLALRANQTVVAYEDGIRWDVLRDAPALVAVLDKLRRSRLDIEDFIERHPYRDNYLARGAVFAGKSRRNFLQAMAGIPYGGDRLAIRRDAGAQERFGLGGASYVTVHNGFDPDFIIAGQRATKCYPHFGRVVRLMREINPGIVFVQLGTSTSEPIAECDLDLIGRTTLAEVAGLIGGAVAHLDNEGGLVHLAACLGVPAIVLFGPTPSDYFGYPGNINIDPAVCGDCWWLTRSWMSQCVKGYHVPRCLHEQKPETVVARAKHLLARGVMAEDPPRDAQATGELERTARTP